MRVPHHLYPSPYSVVKEVHVRQAHHCSPRKNYWKTYLKNGIGRRTSTPAHHLTTFPTTTSITSPCAAVATRTNPNSLPLFIHSTNVFLYCFFAGFIDLFLIRPSDTVQSTRQDLYHNHNHHHNLAHYGLASVLYLPHSPCSSILFNRKKCIRNDPQAFSLTFAAAFSIVGTYFHHSSPSPNPHQPLHTIDKNDMF